MFRCLLAVLLLLAPPDPGDEFRWPNDQWFRQEAANWANTEVAAYPFLQSAVFVRNNAKVTLNIAGALGAYVDATVWSQDYDVFFTARIWVPLPRYRQWQSDSPS